MKNKKKRNLIIVAVIPALIVIGAIGNAFKKDEPAAPAAQAKVQAQTAKQGLTLPDYTGKTLDIAYAELAKAGVKYKAVDTVNDAGVWSPKNWVVESHKPAAGATVAEGTTVTFKVSKSGAAEAKAAAKRTAAAAGRQAQEWEQTALDGLGLKSWAEACGNPDLTWPCYVAGFESPSPGTSVVTLQFGDNDADRKELGERAANALLNTLGYDDESLTMVQTVDALGGNLETLSRSDSRLLDRDLTGYRRPAQP